MRVLALLGMPIQDTFRGLERALEGGVPALLGVLGGCVLGWWVYVPCHELLHALACVVTGGEVTRLEIAPQYGASLLARVFPFVTAGGENAGRLSGFDTHGSDLIYLATDLGPFLLTLFPGVWLLRKAGSRCKGLLFGLSLPLALAPFVSLTGDAYEIGSIVATRAPLWSTLAWKTLLRGDDLFAIIPVVRADGSATAWLGMTSSFLLGAMWAWGTYFLASWIAARLGAAPLRPSARPSGVVISSSI